MLVPRLESQVDGLDRKVKQKYKYNEKFSLRMRMIISFIGNMRTVIIITMVTIIMMTVTKTFFQVGEVLSLVKALAEKYWTVQSDDIGIGNNAKINLDKNAVVRYLSKYFIPSLQRSMPILGVDNKCFSPKGKCIIVYCLFQQNFNFHLAGSVATIKHSQSAFQHLFYTFSNEMQYIDTMILSGWSDHKQTPSCCIVFNELYAISQKGWHTKILHTYFY